MKKTICILVSIFILMMSMSVWASATTSSNTTYNYEIDNAYYTVEFSNDNLTTEEQEIVATQLVGLNDDSLGTYGLGCILFGHDYKYTSASVISHKVRTYSPRCKREIYDVTYCEDCDYTEQTLIGTMYIDCCPED